MSERIDEIVEQFRDDPESHPHLILGQLERVGSTFLLDMHEKESIVHNEPYKQFVPVDWPIARGYEGKRMGIDEFLDSPDTEASQKLWLYNFVLSRYQPGGQIMKETNLYLALPEVLELFPYRTTEVLSRNPLGIVSSFKRNDLYHLWDYDHVRSTLALQLENVDAADGELLKRFTQEGDSWYEKLIWMAGLNALILSHNLRDKTYGITTYDDVVRLGNPDGEASRLDDSIFGTNVRKEYDDFDRRLTATELGKLAVAAEACINYVEREYDEDDKALFRLIFSDYFKRSYNSRHGAEEFGAGGVNDATPSSYTLRPHSELPAMTEMRRLIAEQPIVWSEKLATNQEAHVFLNELLEAGLRPNLTALFIRDNMPPQRGGRLIFNKSSRQFAAVDGYSDHPVYWMTWLGAASYAAWRGGRLPTAGEWAEVYEANKDALWQRSSNHSYSHDDVIPTGGSTDAVPQDFFGNLKIWCDDWSSEGGLRLSKNLAGISWKHYLHDEYKPVSEKPFLTNSRVIGTRVVGCDECKLLAITTPSQMVQTVHDYFDSLGEDSLDSAEKVSNANDKLANAIRRLGACIHAPVNNIGA